MAAQRADKERRQLERFNLKHVDSLAATSVKGSGAYGVVHKVTANGMQCIAKRVHGILTGREVGAKQKSFIVSKFQEECLLTSQLRHPNVVHFVGVHFGSRPEDLSLVLECLETDLARYLTEAPGVSLPTKLSIVLDISYGLLYLHTRDPPIIHRDLTANNVLLTGDLRAKIADLGVSKVLDIHRQAELSQTKVPGSHYYMPPEAQQENPQYDCKLDIFSFGHLMIFIANQAFPLVHERVSQQALQAGTIQILKRQANLDIMGREHVLYPLCTQCLLDRPQHRPTALELNAVVKQLHSQHVMSSDTKDADMFKEPKNLEPNKKTKEPPQLQQEESEIDQLRKVNKDYRRDMSTVLKKYTDAMSEADMYKEQLKAKESQNLQQESELLAATEEKEALLQEVATLKEELRQAREMSKLPKKVKELQARVVKKDTEIAGLKSTKESLTDLVKMLAAANKTSENPTTLESPTEGSANGSSPLDESGLHDYDEISSHSLDDSTDYDDVVPAEQNGTSRRPKFAKYPLLRRNSPHPNATKRLIKIASRIERPSSSALTRSPNHPLTHQRISHSVSMEAISSSSISVGTSGDFSDKPMLNVSHQKIAKSRSQGFAEVDIDSMCSLGPLGSRKTPFSKNLSTHDRPTASDVHDSPLTLPNSLDNLPSQSIDTHHCSRMDFSSQTSPPPPCEPTQHTNEASVPSPKSVRGPTRFDLQEVPSSSVVSRRKPHPPPKPSWQTLTRHTEATRDFDDSEAKLDHSISLDLPGSDKSRLEQTLPPRNVQRDTKPTVPSYLNLEVLKPAIPRKLPNRTTTQSLEPTMLSQLRGRRTNEPTQALLIASSKLPKKSKPLNTEPTIESQRYINLDYLDPACLNTTRQNSQPKPEGRKSEPVIDTTGMLSLPSYINVKQQGPSYYNFQTLQTSNVGPDVLPPRSTPPGAVASPTSTRRPYVNIPCLDPSQRSPRVPPRHTSAAPVEPGFR